MKFHLKNMRVQLLFVLIFSIMFTVSARRYKEGDVVKIDFNPSLDLNKPTLSVRPIDQGKDFKGTIIIEAYAVDHANSTVTNQEKEILETKSIDGKNDFIMDLPNRGAHEVLGVEIFQKDSPEKKKKSIADYRFLYFPKGNAMKYKGSPKLKRPRGFRKYWDEAYEKLSQVEMNAKIEEVKDRETDTGRLYKVTLNSYWNLPIVCWYYVPKDIDVLNPKANAKKYPVIQFMPGWGAEEPPIDMTKDGYITLSVNPKSHGPSKEYFKTPIAHHLWNIDQPEDYYYRAAFMDCRRGIDFLESRPEIDQTRIGVRGGSQGGAFALAMGSLDPRVDCVVSHVPYIINFPDYSFISTLGSGYIFTKMTETDDPAKNKRTKRTIAMTDIANHVKDIKAPTLIIVGGQDPVCPPQGGLVVFNRINKKVEKKFIIDPDAQHEISPLMHSETKKWFDSHFK